MRDLFWDTKKQGIDCARLTPWTIPQHFEQFQSRLAAVKAGSEKLAKEIFDAYKEQERLYFERVEETDKYVSVFAPQEKVTKTETTEVEVKPEVKKKPGRPKKQ